MSLTWCAMIMCAGCGTHMSFTRTNGVSQPMQARGPAQVDLFTTGAPARPRVELGIVESERASANDDEALITKMRAYAGELGCDALVIFSDNAATPSRTIKGACLAYTAPPAMQPPPAAAAAGITAPSVACIPSTTQLCYGPGGCRGSQTCSGDGKSHSSCDCAASSSDSTP